MNDHWQCSTMHQHQTKGQCHPTHIQCMVLDNWPELCNKKSQEIIDNTIITGNYFTGNPLQQAIMIGIPECFTSNCLQLHKISPTYFESTFLPQQNLNYEHCQATNNKGSSQTLHFWQYHRSPNHTIHCSSIPQWQYTTQHTSHQSNSHKQTAQQITPHTIISHHQNSQSRKLWLQYSPGGNNHSQQALLCLRPMQRQYGQTTTTKATLHLSLHCQTSSPTW